MDYRTTLTTCTYCGCGCNLFLESIDGELTGSIPCKTSPVNEGKLCIKGWNAHAFVQSPKRLKQPLMRKNGALVEVSWNEALDFAASRLKEEYDVSGKTELFERLKDRLTERDGEATYEAVAEAMGASPGAMKMAVQRMRKRYSIFIRDAIAATVARRMTVW